MRFLIDECLSVALVAIAAEAGHEARHVAHIGRAGWKDWEVVRYAAAEDCVVVTNNASDFRRLFAAQKLHAGLVILIPNAGRTMQCRLFKAALDELASLGEPVNQVFEVDLDGGDVTFALYDLPAKIPVANRNHRRVGSQSSDGRAQNDCNGTEGRDPQSLRLSP